MLITEHREIPPYGKAVLAALRFSPSDLNRVRSLSGNDWKKLLAFCDASQLTFTFARLCGSNIPDWVRSRIHGNQSDSAKRQARLHSAVAEISRRFNGHGIDFVLLKGFTHAQAFSPDSSLRTTADIDLLCRPGELMRARDALLGLGYRPFGSTKGRHLPSMIREAEWNWRGDYYAADLPLPVDLHYKLWDEELEYIPGPPEDEFWSRRSYYRFGDEMLPVLALTDSLAFAALHLLMHILHGDLRLQRAWEIGYFLHHRACDDEFWSDWLQLHDPHLRMLQVIIFCLVQRWFHCRVSAIIEREMAILPQGVKLWLKQYGLSPITALFTKNKDEIWLNLCLVQSLKGKVNVLVRRLLPLSIGMIAAPANSNTGLGFVSRCLYRVAFIVARTKHHIRTFPSTLLHGVTWCWILIKLRNESHSL